MHKLLAAFGGTVLVGYPVRRWLEHAVQQTETETNEMRVKHGYEQRRHGVEDAKGILRTTNLAGFASVDF